MRTEDQNLVAFFVLTFTWSWAIWAPEVLVAQGIAEVPRPPRIAAFGPTVAAFVLVFWTRGRTGVFELAKRGVDTGFNNWWLLPVLFLFPLMNGSLLLAGYLTLGTLPSVPWSEQLASIPIAFVYILFLAGPLQEEFGWRGYALDRLQVRWNAFVSSLILGAIWAAWHLPLFFFSESSYYRAENLGGTMVSIVLLAIIITWIYNNTGGSLLATLFAHASFNFSHWAFPVLDTEFGRRFVLIVLLVLTVAIVVGGGPNSLVRGRDREWLVDTAESRSV